MCQRKPIREIARHTVSRQDRPLTLQLPRSTRQSREVCTPCMGFPTPPAPLRGKTRLQKKVLTQDQNQRHVQHAPPSGRVDPPPELTRRYPQYLVMIVLLRAWMISYQEKQAHVHISPSTTRHDWYGYWSRCSDSRVCVLNQAASTGVFQLLFFFRVVCVKQRCFFLPNPTHCICTGNSDGHGCSAGSILSCDGSLVQVVVHHSFTVASYQCWRRTASPCWTLQ